MNSVCSYVSIPDPHVGGQILNISLFESVIKFDKILTHRHFSFLFAVIASKWLNLKVRGITFGTCMYVNKRIMQLNSIEIVSF